VSIATTTTPATPGLNPPRAVRNNNPGNIKASATTTTFPGVAGVDPSPASDGGKFLQFETPEDGFAAMGRLLRSGGYRGLSVDRALRRWSNNGYGGNLAEQIGLDPTRRMDSLDPRELGALTQAMAHAEGYRPAAATDGEAAQAQPPIPRPALPPLLPPGPPPGTSMSMRSGKFSASLSGVPLEQRKQMQFDADLAAIMPTLTDFFQGDVLAAEEAGIAEIAAQRGPSALPPKAYDAYAKRRRVGEAAEKAAAGAEAKAQFTPTEQQDAALRLFDTPKYGSLSNGQKAQVDAFLMGRESAKVLNTRGAEIGARAAYPATPEDELLALPPGPAPGPTGTTVPAPTTRGEARQQREVSMAEAKANLPARASGAERAYLRQAVSMTKAIERTGRLFAEGGSFLTGLSGIPARTMGDFLGTNTAAQTQFKQTNQMVENLLVYMTTGKAINEQEAARIKATVTDVRLAPRAWLARFNGLVRFTVDQLDADADIMETDRLRAAGIPRKAAARLRAQFPDAFAVEPDAVRDKALAQGDEPAAGGGGIAVPGFPGFTIGGE